MPIYRWRIDFSLPGIPIAKELAIDSMHLTPHPRGEHELSRSDGYLILETEEFLQEPDVRARTVPRLEALAMAAASLGGSVQKPIVTSIRLENEEELRAVGAPTPSLHGRLLLTLEVMAADIDEVALTAAYHAAGAREDDEVARWRRSARWLWKANSDPEPYDQFLALWISFNVLYGGYSPHGEQAAIQTFLEEKVPTEEDAQEVSALIISNSLALLASSGLTLRNRTIAHQLRDALAAQRPRREVVVLVMLTIYAVRCAIFHEGGIAIPGDLEARLILGSRDILKVVLMHLIRRRLGVSFGTRSRGETPIDPAAK